MSYDLKLLKAFADETRLNIVLNLMKKEMHVLEIVPLVNKSQPNISIALRKLQEADVISSRKEQRNVYYKIVNKEKISKILELVKK